MGESVIIGMLFDFVLEWAIDNTIKIKVKRVVDAFNNICIHLGIDNNGDGVLDEDEVLYTVRQFIPDLSDGFTVCNSGDEIGIGYPLLSPVDSLDLPALLSGDTLTGTNDGIIIDYDNDGENDDVLLPLPYDFTGDGQSDWALVVDDNNDGFPDSNTDLPFYPVGSTEFNDYLYAANSDSFTIMHKPLAYYSVTEGILFIGLLVASFGFVFKMFRRRRVL